MRLKEPSPNSSIITMTKHLSCKELLARTRRLVSWLIGTQGQMKALVALYLPKEVSDHKGGMGEIKRRWAASFHSWVRLI